MGNYQKYLKVILSLVIALAPVFIINSANASTIAGWNITNQIAQGASLALSATKTVIINGASVLKTSTAKITPNASQVAKILRGGAAGYALSIAVEQLLGSVDWVLDPANNAIQYTELVKPDELPPFCENVYRYKDSKTNNNYVYGCSIQEIANSFQSYVMSIKPMESLTITSVTTNYFTYDFVCKSGSANITQCGSGSGTNFKVTPAIIVNPAYDPTATDERKTLPLDVVGQQVIDNANSGDTTAQEATTAAAQDMLANDAATQSDVETQLNTNAKTQTSEEAAAEATPKDPAVPEAGTNIKITFPVFCGWAPIVCEAAQSAIKFPTTVTNWWNTATQAISTAYTETKEWLREEPQQDTELNIQEETQQEPDTTINFASTCPDKIPIMLEWNGRTIDFSFDFTIWCNATSTFLKPVVIALGSLHALYIVAGIRQDG